MDLDGIQIGGLYYDLDIRDGKLEGTLAENDKKVKKFGESIDDSGKKISENLSKAAKGFAIVGAGLTIVSKQATDFTVDLYRESVALGREIGVSTEEASRLTAAFKRMGIESEAASQMFGIFSKRIVASTETSDSNRIATEKLRLQIEQTKRSITEVTAEIAKNGDSTGELGIKLKTLNNTLAAQQDQLNKSADSFAKLGISTKDAQGKQKGFMDLLLEVSDAFKKLPDGAEKTAMAMDLFGRSGKDMIKVLNLGSEGILELQKEADRLGLTLNSETIGNVARYIQAQKDLKQSTDAIKIAIGTATTPYLTEFNQALNSIIQDLISSDGWIKTLTVSVLAFGGPVLAGAGAVAQLGANFFTMTSALGLSNAALLAFVGTMATAIGVAAALAAALVAVYAAAKSVLDALKAVDNARKAKDILIASTNDAVNKINSSTRLNEAQKKEQIQKLFNSLASNYGGTDNWRGGLTWVHEKGPEIIDLPKGTRIIPNDLSKEMMRNGTAMGAGNVNKTVVNIGTVNDRSDADYIIRRVDRSYQLAAMGVSS